MFDYSNGTRLATQAIVCKSLVPVDGGDPLCLEGLLQKGPLVWSIPFPSHDLVLIRHRLFMKGYAGAVVDTLFSRLGGPLLPWPM